MFQFKVNYVLSNYSEHTPILNKTSVEHFVATFQKDCGNDDLCQSNLILKGDVVKGNTINYNHGKSIFILFFQYGVTIATL